MSSQAQVDANRRNAQQSTGPASTEGKRRVSRNAVTHGLNCREILLPGEDGKQLVQYRKAMIADHQPVGAEEQDCVERMVAAYWRIQRLWRSETNAYAHERYRLGSKTYDEAACVMHNLQQEKTFAYLDRKEAHLSREYARCSRRLQELQDQRRKGTRHVLEEATAAQEPEAAKAPMASAGEEIRKITEQSQLPVEAPMEAMAAAPVAAQGETVTATVSASDDGAIRETTEQSQSAETGEQREAA